MKNILLLLFLIPVLSFSQNFEGTLVYENDIEIAEKFSKQFGMTKEKMMESGQFFEETLTTYKNGFNIIQQSQIKYVVGIFKIIKFFTLKNREKDGWNDDNHNDAKRNKRAFG